MYTLSRKTRARFALLLILVFGFSAITTSPVTAAQPTEYQELKGASCTGDDYAVINCIVGQGLGVILYLAAGFFGVRMLIILYSSQIDMALGKPGGAADMIQEMVYLLITLVMALELPSIAQGFVDLSGDVIICSPSGGAISCGSITLMTQMIAPLIGFLAQIILTLAFAAFSLGAVFNGLQAQLSNLLGRPGGWAEAAIRFGSAMVTFVLGLAFIRIGNSVAIMLIDRLLS
jgi:hypothetical protein